MAVKKRSKLVMLMQEEKELGTYSPEEKDIHSWFKVINQELFDNVLPKFDNIRIEKFRNKWAECICHKYDDNSIVSNLDLRHEYHSKQHFVNVLAHEMIHLWEFHFFGTMRHGKKFYSWREKLEKFNMELFKNY